MGNVVSNSGLDKKITVEEVINGISELSNRISPSEDGILNEMLKSVTKIIFDKMITPILLYGCEVWGWEYCDQIENVQFYFYKRILGLGPHTSHIAVTG